MSTERVPFKLPESVDQAHELVIEITDNIRAIEDHVVDEDRREKFDTDEAYRAWKRSAKFSLRARKYELDLVNEYLRKAEAIPRQAVEIMKRAILAIGGVIQSYEDDVTDELDALEESKEEIAAYLALNK